MLRLVSTTVAFAILTSLLAVSASAQGTATGPVTKHLIDPNTGVVWIGGANDPLNGPNPIPIDLDRNGDPWIKEISTGPNGTFGGGTLIIRESIRNVGTEPWHDWHEVDLQQGSHGTAWGGVSDVRINGSSINFSALLGGGTIDLDDFSQSVLPGDLLEIDKRLEALTDNFVGPNTVVATIAEYPTTDIPEPAAALLLLSACGVLLGRARW